jgi:hypothetical protein
MKLDLGNNRLSSKVEICNLPPIITSWFLSCLGHIVEEVEKCEVDLPRRVHIDGPFSL